MVALLLVKNAWEIGLALLLFAGVLWVIARRTRRLEREIAVLDRVILFHVPAVY